MDEFDKMLKFLCALGIAMVTVLTLLGLGALAFYVIPEGYNKTLGVLLIWGVLIYLVWEINSLKW